jgi:hypothetical protein
MESNKKARVIAFYLPQYYPTPNNDKWWGKGFTEWTNVCRAKPLFKGHYQPHVPADLGFYDLRLSETRIAQAEMAKEYGIEGFCYYHYWFGFGRQELEYPFKEVLNSGSPNFPFMLCWANESWHAKFWSKNEVSSKKLLVEQKYGGTEDYIQHFNAVLPAFKDKRYIRLHNKPLFMIYHPLAFDDITSFITLWQQLAKENGMEGIYFIGQTTDIKNTEKDIFDRGFDAINTVRHYDILTKSFCRKLFRKIWSRVMLKPSICSYADAMKYFIGEQEYKNNVIPTLLPNWDHTPRSGVGGYLLINSTPKLFGRHVKKTMSVVKNKPDEERIVFIKSWNEWGEGNHMEPDLKYGMGYLEELKNNM